MYKLISTLWLILITFNLSVRAQNEYCLKQDNKLFGTQEILLNDSQFSLLNLKQSTQIYCQKPDYLVYYINLKKKIYYTTIINDIKDPQGSGIVNMLVYGGKLMKNTDCWVKKGILKNKNYTGFVYKFKYPDNLPSKTNIFYKLIISDVKDINPNFLKLHSKLNGFPVLPSLVLELSYINESARIDEFITTSELLKSSQVIHKPNLNGFTKVNSYSEYLGLVSNKKILNDFFDLTK